MTHFKAHQGIHRVYNKTHVCPICDVSFQRKIKLNEHLTNAHGTMIESNVNTETNLMNQFEKEQEQQAILCTEPINALILESNTSG